MGAMKEKSLDNVTVVVVCFKPMKKFIKNYANHQIIITIILIIIQIIYIKKLLEKFSQLINLIQFIIKHLMKIDKFFIYSSIINHNSFFLSLSGFFFHSILQNKECYDLNKNFFLFILINHFKKKFFKINKNFFKEFEKS